MNEAVKLLALAEDANNKSNEILYQYQQQFIEVFKGLLIQGGIKYQNRINIADYYDNGQLRLSIYFYSDENHRSDFTVELEYKENSTKVSRLSATGKSINGDDITSNDMEEYLVYYKMVFEIINQHLSSYKKPRIEWVSDYKLKEQKRQLENELKVAELDIQVGKELEFFDKTSRRRNAWFTAIIEKINPKSIVVKSGYNTYTIKSEDFHWRLRPVQEEKGEEK